MIDSLRTEQNNNYNNVIRKLNNQNSTQQPGVA